MTVETATENKSISSNKLMYWLPSILFLIAAILLVASINIPYWNMVLHAPQYPDGLKMRVFVNEMTGDEDPQLDEVAEIDGLNHYIGMKSLYNAAEFERSIALPAVGIFIISLIVAAVWRRKWVWALAIPPLTFPFVFIADLALWMRHYGQNLDPYAPLSSAIKPFTPTVIGEGGIAQFRTVAKLDVGWYMIFAGSLAIAVAFILLYLDYRKTKSEA